MKPDSKKLSNPQSIEDVLMQCGAYGSSDSKYIADSIRAWLNSRPIDPKAFEAMIDKLICDDTWDGHQEVYSVTRKDLRQALKVYLKAERGA